MIWKFESIEEFNFCNIILLFPFHHSKSCPPKYLKYYVFIWIFFVKHLKEQQTDESRNILLLSVSENKLE